MTLDKRVRYLVIPIVFHGGLVGRCWIGVSCREGVRNSISGVQNQTCLIRLEKNVGWRSKVRLEGGGRRKGLWRAVDCIIISV